MSKYLLTTAIVGCLASSPVLADPSLMLGMSFSFEKSSPSKWGITGQVLSDNRPNTWVAAAGATYYPKSNTWGFNVGGGYAFKRNAIILTYDFLNEDLHLSAGWANLEALS
jgi:hypothetical protein